MKIGIFDSLPMLLHSLSGKITPKELPNHTIGFNLWKATDFVIAYLINTQHGIRYQEQQRHGQSLVVAPH
ncbi:MAG: hypothetical protein A2W91_01735 [Bacteroidetes bacterium GWF2_38_335]|nr:MAG: hypothetical protein A2W91_01735 [Bacteroidetes bacterium GWF2_38_335]OFY78790.1 MAG: hypothetical protein A2281_19310 [Bacteroidetes bacterium RIFOXYA12_FULL_38_20]HBS85185.1 hypothetical protein [Bacteroidales bacterium]